MIICRIFGHKKEFLDLQIMLCWCSRCKKRVGANYQEDRQLKWEAEERFYKKHGHLNYPPGIHESIDKNYTWVSNPTLRNELIEIAKEK